LAFTFTWPGASSSTSAMRSRMAAMCGARRGAWAMTVLSMFTTA